MKYPLLLYRSANFYVFQLQARLEPQTTVIIKEGLALCIFLETVIGEFGLRQMCLCLPPGYNMLPAASVHNPSQLIYLMVSSLFLQRLNKRKTILRNEITVHLRNFTFKRSAVKVQRPIA